jgi:hypothetical protein
MRKLVLLLIAFIAVANFIRAFDKSGSNALNNLTQQVSIEAEFND